MDSWLRGRGAIFNSLADLCDKIEDELKAELQQEAGNQRRTSVSPQELELLRGRAADADRLEEENRKLRTWVEQYIRDQRTSETVENSERRTRPSEQSLTAREPLTPISNNQLITSTRRTNREDTTDDVDWKRQAAINGAKFTRINAELQKAKETLVRFKQERDGWKQFAEKWEQKVKNMEAKLGHSSVQPEVAVSSNLAVQPGIQSSRTSPLSFDHVSRSSSTLPQEGQRSSPEKATREASANADCRQGLEIRAEPVENPATEHDPDVQLPALSNDESATKLISIKQEPSSDSPVVVSERTLRKRKHEDTDTREQASRRVKREDTGSDPVVTAELCDFSPAESVDLDEARTKLDTPRKRRALETARLGISLDLNVTPCRTGLFIPDVHQKPVEPVQATKALQARDPNIQSWNAQDRSLKRGLSRAVASLAEDGAVYKTNPGSRSDSIRHDDSAPEGKLKCLLDRPQADPGTPIIRSAGRGVARVHTASDDTLSLVPQTRDLPFDKAIRGRTKAFPKTQGGTVAAPTREKPGAEPLLRSRPRSALRLDDFKINPKFNSGYQYAFTEVVRNRDERARLPGCVDPDCCGRDFRAMAIAERGAGLRTPDQQAEDRKLLEDYLGQESLRLFNMTKEEKDVLWIDAKTREIADRCGKHRHRFTRMKSPPGFWRTDFPDTQEMAQDRAEAMRREKEMVQERYREAMRPDGRWKFRDE